MFLVILLFIFSSYQGCIHEKDDGSLDKDVFNRVNFKLNRVLEAKKSDENYAYSTYSLMSVAAPMISMLEVNARKNVEKAIGSTHEAMEKALYSEKGNTSVFSYANKIWMDLTVQVDIEKLKKMSDKTAESIEVIDIKNNPVFAENLINDWVKFRTQGMIEHLLKSGTLKSDTKLVVTNAISFRGSWKTPFDKKLTKNRSFYVSADKTIKVPTMANTISTNYYNGDIIGQMLEIPYEGGQYSMFILLPKNSDCVNMNAVTSAIQKMEPMRIKVLLPKFQITSTSHMKDYADDLGLEHLFGKVDLLKDDVYFKDIIHKVNVKVDEAGTVASGASAGITGRSMLPLFRVNKPFYFFIKDLESHMIIFFGKITVPRW